MAIDSNSPQTSEMFDLVVTNALDFLRKAVSELDISPKYSVINFYSAVELLLKAKLLLEHWSLIVVRPNEAVIGKFNAGDFASVGLDDSLKRLENIAGETITKEAKKSFDALRNHRNKLVHFSTPEYFVASSTEALHDVLAEQCRVWFYLHELLTQYWSEDFSEYLTDIDNFDSSMHEKAEYLKAKYDLLGPKIKLEIAKGIEYIECPFCTFKAVKVTVQTCEICGNVNVVENPAIAYMGIVLGGPFTLSPEAASEMINQSNKDSHINNADVIKPWRTGKDIALDTESFVIDFGDMELEEAEKYEAPFRYLLEKVYPVRRNARNKQEREFWWQFSRPRYELRRKLAQSEKYIATPNLAKYNFFVWLDSAVIPGQTVTVITTSDSYVFGVLHSRCHAVWIEYTASRSSDFARYTPSVFQNFPFPYPIQVQTVQRMQRFRSEIGRLADQFNDHRIACLQNHNDLKVTEYNNRGMSMTQLYNGLYAFRAIPTHAKTRDLWEIQYADGLSFEEVKTLDTIQNALDEAVLKAYGWQLDISNDEIADKLALLKAQ